MRPSEAIAVPLRGLRADHLRSSRRRQLRITDPEQKDFDVRSDLERLEKRSGRSPASSRFWSPSRRCPFSPAASQS